METQHFLKKIKSFIREKQDSNNPLWKTLYSIRNLYGRKKYNVAKIINKKVDESRIKLVSSRDFTDISLRKPIKSYAFVFVCQNGKLEIGSLFLAASLKRYLKCEYELIAAIPGPEEIMGKPNKITLDFFNKIGVRIFHFNNEIVAQGGREKQHFITNKMYCFKVPTSAEKLIFLDSDMMCHSDFYSDTRFSIPFNGRQVALHGTQHVEGKWYKFYELMNIEMPNVRIRVDYPEGYNYIPPCFQSSFVAVNSDLSFQLFDEWMECWHAIDKSGLIKYHPYHIGQFALAIAVIKMDIPYELVDRVWYYKYFYNYNVMSELTDNNEAVTLAKSLLNENHEISEMVKESQDYKFLLD